MKKVIANSSFGLRTNATNFNKEQQ